MTAISPSLKNGLEGFQAMMDVFREMQTHPDSVENVERIGAGLHKMYLGLKSLALAFEPGSRPSLLINAQVNRCETLQSIIDRDSRPELIGQAVDGVLRGLRLCRMLPEARDSFSDWVEKSLAFYHDNSSSALLEKPTLDGPHLGEGRVGTVRADMVHSKANKFYDANAIKNGIVCKRFRHPEKLATALALGFWSELAHGRYISDFGTSGSLSGKAYYLRMPLFKKRNLYRMDPASAALAKESWARKVAVLIKEDHVRGVVHGDIKDAHVMSADADADEPVLIDYNFSGKISRLRGLRRSYWDPDGPTIPDNSPNFDVICWAVLLIDVFMKCSDIAAVKKYLYDFQNSSDTSQFSQIPPRLIPILKQALTPESYPSGVELVQAIEIAFSAG